MNPSRGRILEFPREADPLRREAGDFDSTDFRRRAWRRTLPLHERLSYSHDCLGEEVLLRMVDAHVGQVLFCDRCALDAETGCDGIPSFNPGEWVVLPVEWAEARWRPIRPSDLRVTTGPPSFRFESGTRSGERKKLTRRAM